MAIQCLQQSTIIIDKAALIGDNTFNWCNLIKIARFRDMPQKRSRVLDPRASPCHHEAVWRIDSFVIVANFFSLLETESLVEIQCVGIRGLHMKINFVDIAVLIGFFDGCC